MNRAFLIFLGSFIMQLVFIFYLNTPLQGDALLYDKIANNFIAGKGFSEDGVHPSAGYIKHGYILFLAVLYKIFGHSILAVKIAQSLLIAGTCIMSYLIGRLLFNERIGYYIGLVTAFHPAFLIISSHIASESLFTLLFAVSVFYLIAGFKKRSLKAYLVSAVFLGIALHVRFTPIFFPFFIFLGLLLFYKEKCYVLKAGVMILVTVIFIVTPWTIRNYIHFGYLNPFLEYGGTLWIGSFTKGEARQDSPEMKRATNEVDKSLERDYLEKGIIGGEFDTIRQNVLMTLAIKNIKKDPMGYIALFPMKILRLWTGSYSGLFMINIPFSEFLLKPEMIKEHPFILSWKTFVFLFSWVVFFLGIAGMIKGLKIWKEILPLYLVVFYFTFLHMVVFSNTRMGIPALPYMIMFCILGASRKGKWLIS